MPSNYSFLDETIAGSAIPYELDDLKKYSQDGITHIISLTPKLPLVSKYYDKEDLSFHHYPVYATPDAEQLMDFVTLMKELRNSGEKAVVHCQYGQERTGIFLASYLIEVKGMSRSAAVNHITKNRPSSLQTSHARRFLKDHYD